MQDPVRFKDATTTMPKLQQDELRHSTRLRQVWSSCMLPLHDAGHELFGVPQGTLQRGEVNNRVGDDPDPGQV